jgi:uncharacterized protein (DUF697 family)
MAKLLPHVFSNLDKLVSKLPKQVREPVLDHIRSMEDLFAHGQLEAARRSTDQAVKLEAADRLVKTASAICTTVGIEPIPLADFPILTSIQVLMVSGIIYVSGREARAKAGAEFIGALGTHIGAAIVLREGARAIAKLLPGWGSAVSGAIAGAGTFAIGRAATGYFIEGVSIKDARKLFLRSRRTEKKVPLALPAPASRPSDTARARKSRSSRSR